MKPRYIFVVGLPRTGSKLLESVLRNSRHIDYQSAGETHYVGHLISPGIKDEVMKIGDMSQDANVHKLIDYFYEGTPDKGFWKQLKRERSNGKINVDRGKFLQELLASDRTAKGIYEVILQIHTTTPTRKTILGDKTLTHLYHVETLLQWFPQAKIIHLFRDPRAILASEWVRRMKRYPRRSYLCIRTGKLVYSFMIVVHMTVAWLYAARLHRKYQEQYPQNYYLLKFEDLVGNAESSVRELCGFLEIDYDPMMLKPKQVGSSFAQERIVGFDQKTLTRWRNHLKPWMKTWMTVWGRKYMREFGYLDS